MDANVGGSYKHTVLQFPFSGYRDRYGNLNQVGSNALIWSSATNWAITVYY